MTKIMLVEDDKSLREIYGVRLLAEGYDIVSAGDGEEALAMAIKERPQLIISDVMMPKVSGYDMLDILRSTTETKNIRVIMMTALSSNEQQSRAESLGADRYLVKSQVGIEDVVRVVHEVLEDLPGTSLTTPAPPVNPVPMPAAPAPTSSTPHPTPAATTPLPAPGTVTGTPQLSQTPTAPRPSGVPKPASLKTRVIQPLNDPGSTINLNELLDKELAKEAGIGDNERPVVASEEAERAELAEQLAAFTPPAEPTPLAPPTAATPVTTPAPSPLPMPGVGLSQQPLAPAPVPPATAPVTPSIATSAPVQQPAAVAAMPPITTAPAPAPVPPIAPVTTPVAQTLTPVPTAPVAQGAPPTAVAPTPPAVPPLPQVPSV